MNVDVGLYGDYEIAGKMLEEHERKDQQVSVEVSERIYRCLPKLLKFK